MGYPRKFPDSAEQAAFLLGGIGTGNVSIGSRGQLRDWEIFNRPEKGSLLPNTHFAIWTKSEGETAVAKILESRINAPHGLSHGYHPSSAAGLPRLDGAEISAAYPFVEVAFRDSDLPVEVTLEAFTPFIPLNAEDSGIPGAILTYYVKNDSAKDVDVTIAGSIFNPIGGVDRDPFGNIMPTHRGGNVNGYRTGEEMSGLYLDSAAYAATELEYGNLSLVTTNRNTSAKPTWLRGPWYDGLQEFWDDLVDDGRLNDLGYQTASEDWRSDTGSLAVHEKIAPGETKAIQFFLAWYFPNRLNGWDHTVRVQTEGEEVTQNYYANAFSDSSEVVRYLIRHYDRLRQDSLGFREALFSSSYPDYVLDAISSNITVLRSPTCFWLKDGRFFGYEGCFDFAGCCSGTCTHVWNYAQTLAFLFPTLEQNMRRTEFLGEVDADGRMNFRAANAFQGDVGSLLATGYLAAPAAADGQLGAIMRVYREWKLTGDSQFLRTLWPAVERTLDYALREWDRDGDLVLDGRQHNTYDIDFYGPNPLTGALLLGALRAAESMADYLGVPERCQYYHDRFEKSSRRLDELLWNGEYFIQSLEEVDQFKYQHGIGCLSDQLLGQQFAHLYGLDYLLPQDHVKRAIQSVFRYNFNTNLASHANPQRTYALNDEQGLVMCSWPQQGRPKFPFAYSDEVWTGVEYQVATHLIYEGLVEEGLAVVQAVRARHDGVRRNPWDEVECGHHYARSMSSWGLLIALSGFRFDMVKKEISFAPALDQGSFSTFWSTGVAWGTYTQQRNPHKGDWDVTVEVLYGDASGLKVTGGGKLQIL